MICIPCLQLAWFNSELEDVEENSVSPDMAFLAHPCATRHSGILPIRCELSFRGTGCTIGSVSIFTPYYKMDRRRIQTRPKARLISVATFSLFRKCCRNAEGLQRGTSALPHLLWCGWSATTLVAAGHILNTLLAKNVLKQTQILPSNGYGLIQIQPLFA